MSFFKEKKLLTCDPLPYPEGRKDGPPRPRDVTVQSEREEEREGQQRAQHHELARVELLHDNIYTD